MCSVLNCGQQPYLYQIHIKHSFKESVAKIPRNAQPQKKFPVLQKIHKRALTMIHWRVFCVIGYVCANPKGRLFGGEKALTL